MLISELSRETGVSIYTLRFYENYGLFKGVADQSVKTNNYKNYDESVIEKIELIKEAKEIGFSLPEIKVLIDCWYNRRMSTKKRVAVFEAKMEEIDLRINQLKEVKKLLKTGIREVARS